MAKKTLSLAAIALAVLLVIPLTARAEPYFAVYMGEAFQEDRDIDTFYPGPGAGWLFPLSVNWKDVDYNNSVVSGVKVGYWLDPLPYIGPYIGLEVEVYHHREDIDNQVRIRTLTAPAFTDTGLEDFNKVDISVWAVGFNLMGRVPLLKSSAFPHGRIQPYAGVGLGIFRSKVEDSVNFEPSGQSEKDTDTGFQVLGGVKFFYTKNVAFFAEYKFTSHDRDLTFVDNQLCCSPSNIPAKVDPGKVRTHYVYGGVAIHF